MNNKIAALGVGAGAIALTAAAMGGIGLANAQDGSQSAQSERQHRGPHGPKGEPVTGETAEQAKTAATDAVPGGTAHHVFARPDGGYAVGMTNADGQRVVVLLTDNFEPEEAKELGDRRGHGPKGEPVTGEAAEQATAAAEAEVSGGTAHHVFARPDGGYAVGMTNDDGNRVVVLLDENYAVEEVKDLPDRRGPKGEPVTGEAAEQAKAAAQEALPNGEPKQVFSKTDGGYAVFVKMQSGKKRVVLLDSEFAVQKIMKAKRGPGKPLTGNTERKAESAATAAVDGTAMRAVQKGNRYYVIVRTDDGGVLVKLNKQFKVLDTEELPERGEGRHHRGPGGPGGFGGPGGPGGPGGSPDSEDSAEQTTTA